MCKKDKRMLIIVTVVYLIGLFIIVHFGQKEIQQEKHGGYRIEINNNNVYVINNDSEEIIYIENQSNETELTKALLLDNL